VRRSQNQRCQTAATAWHFARQEGLIGSNVAIFIRWKSPCRATAMPHCGWTPKAYKERAILIPKKLVKKLKARKAKADKTCGLVFPTAGGAIRSWIFLIA
jgi:hypothetical protein